MVFSDTSTKQGLIQDCEQNIFGSYGDITNNVDRFYDFTARINRAYDKLATRVMAVDGRWQWDDTNQTDFPIGSTALVAGQQDYTMDVEFMDVVKVITLDSAGNKTLLTPFDINDPLGRVVLTTNSPDGIPISYDKTGNSIKLYPTPSYSKAAGLIVHYRRKPSYFSYTDTTNKSVGVPAIFHRYLSLEASLDYAITKQLAIKNDLAVRVKEMEETIDDFYQARSKDESKFIRSVIRSSR